MTSPLHFESYAAMLDGGTTEFGFCFQEYPDAVDNLFDLILGVASKPVEGDPSEPYEWLAEDIANNQDSSRPVELLVMGEECPSDGERLYWSNDDGWVDRSNATSFGVKDALAGVSGLIGAVALELKRACRIYEVTTELVMPDGTTDSLGSKVVAAQSEEQAIAAARDAHWDNRYDITGISLTHETEEIDDAEEIDIDASQR